MGARSSPRLKKLKKDPPLAPTLYPPEGNIGGLSYDPSSHLVTALSDHHESTDFLPDIREERQTDVSRELRAASRTGWRSLALCQSLQERAGVGLFAVRDILHDGIANTFITYYAGSKQDNNKGGSHYLFEALKGRLWIDGDPLKSFGPWANHATDESRVNAKIVYNKRAGSAALWATRLIKAGEEILLFYGFRYFEDDGDELPAEELEELCDRRNAQTRRKNPDVTSNLNNNSYYIKPAMATSLTHDRVARSSIASRQPSPATTPAINNQ